MNIYTPQLIYYVYAYLRPDGTPYYIGKGKDNRAWSSGHTVFLPNDNTRIIIIEANLTEIGAFALERRLIRWYGRKNIGTGILRNQTDGGDGASGAIRSEETKLKISESKKGYIPSIETRNKLSEVMKGRTLSNEHKLKMSVSMKGHIHSPETKLKMSVAHKGRIRSPHSDETRNKLSEVLTGRKLSEEHILKMSELRSKTWNFIDPNGNKLTIKNLTKFCQENYLGISSMTRVAKGEQKSHKGWVKF
jgi:predicted RNA-binding protein with RPS1 domain